MGGCFDCNIDFRLVGRCQLRWKEGLDCRSPWVFGSRPAVLVPEERVHDNELPVENTSASKQGKPHPCWERKLKCLGRKRRRAGNVWAEHFT